MRNYAITFFLLAMSISAQSHPLTLEESLKLGLQNSKEIKISASRLSAANARYEEYSAQILPRLTAGGNYFWISDPPIEFNIPSMPGSMPASGGHVNVINGNITLEQPLFTGLRLSSLKNAAEYDSKAEEVKFNNAKNQTALDIRLAFWNYFKAQNNHESLTENLRSLLQNLELTERFMTNGLATKGDLLKLKVQVSAVELRLVNAKNAADLSRLNFNRLLGLDLAEETEIEVDLMPVEQENSSFEDYLAEAQSNRPELSEINYRLSASSERIDAANASWFPQLNAFGSFYALKVDGSSLPVNNDLSSFWVVGLNLNWNIWNWGATSAQSAQAEELKIQTELSLEMLKEAIETEVYREFVELKSARRKYDLGNSRLASAQENHRISKEKYAAAALTINDLIESEVDLLEARLELNNSIVDYHLAKLKLYKSLGRRLY